MGHKATELNWVKESKNVCLSVCLSVCICMRVCVCVNNYFVVLFTWIDNTKFS